MDDATTRFHAALPYALLPISPSLAALHSVRVKTTFNSCQQCGSTLHRGESSVRTVRSKAPNSRAIQTTCLICGWVHKEPLARGNAALFPRTRKRGAPICATVEKSPAIQRPAIRKVEETLKQSATPINPPSKQQSAPASSLPKSRPKKKGGLYSMLERNKERESREKEKKNEPGGGLAMFLNQL